MTSATTGAALSWPSGARPKACWRCGEDFLCGPGDAGDRCWCDSRPPFSVVNAQADCLCPACLSAVAVPAGVPQAQAIRSPCIQTCRIAPESRLCIGCLRTLDEIAAWAAFSDQERQAVFDALPGRKA